MQWSLRNICACLIFSQLVHAYTAVPRWGQATALLNDMLFVQGGKTDSSNEYSYTSAPNNDDLLFLDLTVSFSTSSPPWTLISSSSNSSTPQGGPSLAWHTLSAFNTSMLLLFGGDPGPNSSPAITTLPDSAVLLNVFNRLSPLWVPEAQSWASEPIRRIHHSASSTDGKLWLIGGEKDDGSNNALSDHWVFDPSGPSFTELPSTNGPPDLYGHASIVLPDGTLIVFGGYCESKASLLPFSTIWALDTTKTTLTWTLLSVSTGSLPSPRRAFVAVILEGGKILIHGGADGTLETVYSDAWILDTTANPMTWSSVTTLSQLGARYDHFAAAVGSQVIFGFGYSSNGPAPAAVQVYNSGSGTFTPSPSFTPQPDSTSNTLPVPTQTNGGGNNGGSTYPPGHTPTGSATGPGVHPTSTDGGGSGSNDSGSSSSHKTAIALGTTFGVLGLVAGVLVTSIYLRKREHPLISRDRFHLLGPSDDEESSPHFDGTIPIAGGGNMPEKQPQGPSAWFPRNGTLLRQLGIGSAAAAGAGAAVSARQRRDMLADEDTREFGGGESFYGVRRDGSAGSSWSLHSVGAMIKSRIRSREPSGSKSRLTTPWQEKDDPFSDGTAALMVMRDDQPTAYSAGQSRDRRQQSYASTSASYVDPFADPRTQDVDDNSTDGDDMDESTSLNRPPPTLQTVLPLSTGVHTLSPLTEQTSRTTLFDPSSSTSASASSHDRPISSFDSRGTSATSHPDSPTALRRPSSIIGAQSVPTQPMRRSDSWWSRFAHTSFLDRRATGAGQPHSRMFDFRDPNPPPRLVAIEESQHSKSPESPESAGSHPSRKNSRRGKVHGGHGRSMSSLRTNKTADSEAIEKMGGMIDVVQRAGTTGSRESHGTMPSSGRNTPDVEARWPIQRPLSIVPSSGPSKEASEDTTMESPIEMAPVHTSMADVDSELATPTRPAPMKRPLSSGAVTARIQDFERRMSQDAESVSSPKSPLSPSARNTRKREEHPSKSRVTINYGLVPRASLYVANPDHSASPSSET